jgi:hypothetical protein
LVFIADFVHSVCALLCLAFVYGQHLEGHSPVAEGDGYHVAYAYLLGRLCRFSVYLYASAVARLLRYGAPLGWTQVRKRGTAGRIPGNGFPWAGYRGMAEAVFPRRTVKRIELMPELLPGKTGWAGRFQGRGRLLREERFLLWHL